MPPDYRTRFAPSPTGHLHLGHAYSALIGWDRAQAASGTFLLRIEDTDAARCRPEYETAIYDMLTWLGIRWARPVLRQSDTDIAYRSALKRLISMDLCYPCRCSRGDIRAALSAPQEGVPYSSPDDAIYPGTCRARAIDSAGVGDAIRLDMARAVAWIGDIGRLGFLETGPQSAGLHRLSADYLIHRIGDVVLARRGREPAYHLAVVVDDAAQGITEVVRGEDLADATQIHRLLQDLLQFQPPDYYHHALIRDSDGKRLAKRDDARSLASYREAEATPADIRALVGLQKKSL